MSGSFPLRLGGLGGFDPLSGRGFGQRRPSRRARSGDGQHGRHARQQRAGLSGRARVAAAAAAGGSAAGASSYMQRVKARGREG
eukprot:366150-Chlamydomonas_euryale.AAC.12